MKPLTRKILISTSAIAFTSAVSYGIYRSIRNKNMVENILSKLESGINQYGTIDDIIGFTGKKFQDSVPKNLNVIKLKDDVAKNYAEKIHKSWGVNDDEEAVYQVFREIKDMYALSQLASAYEAKYKIGLLNELKSRMSTDELDIIYKILNNLKSYRIS